MIQTTIEFPSLIAEVQISYSHKIKPSLQLQICSSADAYKHVLPFWPDIDFKESFAMLLLSRAQRVLGLYWVSHGGITGTVVDVRNIFQASLKANATSIILLHYAE